MLPRTKLLLSLTLFSAVAFAAPRAQADTTIDSFLINPFTATTGPVDDTGGYRNDRESTATNGTIEQAGGILTVTDTMGEGATGTVAWPKATGIAGPDLTIGGDRFELGIISTTGNWTASIYADDGTNSGTVPGVPLPSGVGTVAFSFTDPFFNGVDFSKVQQLKLILTEGPDFLADNSARIDYLTAVPEPSTASMLLLGLLGIARAGRREKTLA